MKTLRFAVLFSALFAGFALSAQQNPAIDHHAVQKTHVPFLNAARSFTRVSSAAAAVMPASASATFGGTAYSVGSTVTATSTVPEAEEEIAVDPLNSSVLVGAISDFSQRGGYNTTKVSYSLDNGAHWNEYFVPENSSQMPTTSDGAAWEANSDPVVAIDRLGNIFVSSLYINVSNNANGLYVAVGNTTSAGHTVGVFPVHTNLSPSALRLEDKPWISVDNGASSPYQGRVYATWTHFIADSHGNLTSDYIFFSRSTTHGKTWTSPLRISPASQDGAVQGTSIAVSPSGKIYVAYEVFYANGVCRQFVTKSIDGGNSFSVPVAITPYFNDLNFGSSYRTNSFPQIAVNPVTGVEYVVYADQPSSTSGAEVEFIRSASAGSLSFSAPMHINDKSSGEQFFPAIATDSSGHIHVSWFDTRNSPTNSNFYDVYATRSLDNGSIWAPNARVTKSSIDAGYSMFIGDYAGITAAGGYAHPVWTNGGFNNGRLQTAALH